MQDRRASRATSPHWPAEAKDLISWAASASTGSATEKPAVEDEGPDTVGVPCGDPDGHGADERFSKDGERVLTGCDSGCDQAIGEVVQVQWFDGCGRATRSGVVRADESVVLGEVVEDEAEPLDAASGAVGEQKRGAPPLYEGILGVMMTESDGGKWKPLGEGSGARACCLMSTTAHWRLPSARATFIVCQPVPQSATDSPRRRSIFLTEVGILSAEDYEISFGLPAEFDDGYIWRRAVQESQGWKFPEGVEVLIKIGNFPINAVVIDPVTGIVYQYTDASMEAIPVHADVSSLAKTVGSFVEYVENYTRGDDEDDEDVEYARRKREVDAIHEAIRLVDPLPFAREYSEWVEMFDNLEGGIYT
ncbi:SUKH-4 family immunity protein [Streptomyces sp. S1A(2023)]